MESKKYKALSFTALVFSILPLATFIPVLLKMTLSDSVRTVWSGANMVCVLLGLILSIVCVKSSESRSEANVISTVISAFWVLLIAGILAMALLLNMLH
ncbi:MAG: hypothetical protein PHU79_00110 [Oscillospiraceae bacterium]|nr:hypothetical protein [Oscillospiraceae bacterium]